MFLQESGSIELFFNHTDYMVLFECVTGAQIDVFAFSKNSTDYEGTLGLESCTIGYYGFGKTFILRIHSENAQNLSLNIVKNLNSCDFLAVTEKNIEYTIYKDNISLIAYNYHICHIHNPINNSIIKYQLESSSNRMEILFGNNTKDTNPPLKSEILTSRLLLFDIYLGENGFNKWSLNSNQIASNETKINNTFSTNEVQKSRIITFRNDTDKLKSHPTKYELDPSELVVYSSSFKDELNKMVENSKEIYIRNNSMLPPNIKPPKFLKEIIGEVEEDKYKDEPLNKDINKVINRLDPREIASKITEKPIVSVDSNLSLLSIFVITIGAPIFCLIFFVCVIQFICHYQRIIKLENTDSRNIADPFLKQSKTNVKNDPQFTFQSGYRPAFNQL